MDEDPDRDHPAGAVRLDKWLWAARFFKTRSIAQQAIEVGRVRIKGVRVKPAHAVRAGEKLEITIGDARIEIVVRALSSRRGAAPVARELYEETPASIARREAQQRARSEEPSISIKGRPTKKQGRDLRRLRGGDG